MAVFIDLWSCLFITKLSYAQLFKWGHSNNPVSKWIIFMLYYLQIFIITSLSSYKALSIIKFFFCAYNFSLPILRARSKDHRPLGLLSFRHLSERVKSSWKLKKEVSVNCKIKSRSNDYCNRLGWGGSVSVFCNN